jgi:hypothetical protein
MNGVAFEVIAEAEITQHLEKGVMSRGVPDIFQVIMFAASTYAFLRRRGTVVGAFVEAEKDILELVHPGIGE